MHSVVAGMLILDALNFLVASLAPRAPGGAAPCRPVAEIRLCTNEGSSPALTATAGYLLSSSGIRTACHGAAYCFSQSRTSCWSSSIIW
eukprot:scaffold81389_cov46-Prasinocladus_malaysianus.AAC.1